MNSEERPDPDQLLEAIKLEESKGHKGRLKIFLGMSAGVGKTYAMLEEAQKLKQDGVDVVVATVNTHGREETEKLLQGLKIIPEKWINYKDTVFEELDLDEILRLNPQAVLVDELAHSNIPGSRHPKRWQDVVEILEHGIDVFTTLNVQHIESLKEIIESITGITIRETVPDSLVESAASIELIDLTPEELLQRLKEGKVYFKDQSALAIHHFFQEDRLTALRSIALRYAAQKIDHDLHGKISTIERKEGWKIHECLLVAISPSPHSLKLIRATRRLAFNLDAPWIALYIDDGHPLSDEDSTMLAKNLSLARDLGAEVLTTQDPNIAGAISRIARQKGVTQIVIGRSPRKSFIESFRNIALVDQLAAQYPDIDIHIIRQPQHTRVEKSRFTTRFFPQHVASYFYIFCLVWLLAGISWLALPLIGYKIVGFLFLLGILIMSLFFKKGPIFFASILYALIWDYFFIPPLGTFIVESNEDSILLVLYLLTAIVTGILTDRIRAHQEMLVKREESVRTLYDITHAIATAPSSKQLLETIKEKLGTVLGGSCEILVKEINNHLILPSTSVLLNDEKERNAARWVFDNGKEAGWSTSTLPSSRNYYVPLKGFNEIVGVLIYRPKLSTQSLTYEERNFLYTIAQHLANYLERSFSEERTRRIEYLNQIEKTHQTILSLLSEEFQRPLFDIQAAIKALKEEQVTKEKRIESKKIQQIENSSERFNQILSNISAMAQLSSGFIRLQKQVHSIRAVVDSCCEHVKKAINGHKIEIHIPETLPLLSFDFALIELLLHNLVVNAAEYSPPTSTIEIDAQVLNNYLVISVSDEGEGIPPDQLDTIFEKFYRIPGSAASGMGLGLAIAKTIAEIHHGYLKAENREVKGAKFSLFLPCTSPLKQDQNPSSQ